MTATKKLKEIKPRRNEELEVKKKKLSKNSKRNFAEKKTMLGEYEDKNQTLNKKYSDT